jgi:hypothetical protein
MLSCNEQRRSILASASFRVATSLAIELAFNMVSVFIQIHFYDIPIQKIWMKYWGRHVFANAIMITVFVAYFGSVLVRVFADNNTTLEEYKLKNCTTLFSFYFAYSLRHFACHL